MPPASGWRQRSAGSKQIVAEIDRPRERGRAVPASHRRGMRSQSALRPICGAINPAAGRPLWPGRPAGTQKREDRAAIGAPPVEHARMICANRRLSYHRARSHPPVKTLNGQWPRARSPHEQPSKRSEAPSSISGCSVEGSPTCEQRLAVDRPAPPPALLSPRTTAPMKKIENAARPSRQVVAVAPRPRAGRQTGADSLNAPIMSQWRSPSPLNRRSSLSTRENHRSWEPVNNSTIVAYRTQVIVHCNKSATHRMDAGASARWTIR